MILVLEDEAPVMRLLRHILKNYQVIEAATAEQALRHFGERQHQVDLLIADVNLPASSGIEVALRARSETPALPVILTSGYPVSGWGPGHAAEFERLGWAGVKVVQKPFLPRAILDAIRELADPS